MGNPDCGAGNCYVQLFQTEDGGQTWTLLKINGPHPDQENLPPGTIHIVSSETFEFQDAGAGGPTIWFGGNAVAECGGTTGSGGTGNSAGAILSSSRDGGKTWKEQKLPLAVKDLDSSAPCPASMPVFLNPREGFLTVQYYSTIQHGVNDLYLAVYATLDGGESWTQLPGQITGAGWSQPVDFVTTKDAIASCGETLCATSDGGKTWNPLASGLHFNLSEGSSALITFDFSSPTTGLANLTGPGENTLLYRTGDGGQNWEQLKPTILTTP